jgi:hypothetical protein
VIPQIFSIPLFLATNLTWQDLIGVFMVGTMEMKSPMLHALSYDEWQTHSWRQWRGCSMNVFPQQVVGVDDINMKIITG